MPHSEPHTPSTCTRHRCSTLISAGFGADPCFSEEVQPRPIYLSVGFLICLWSYLCLPRYVVAAHTLCKRLPSLCTNDAQLEMSDICGIFQCEHGAGHLMIYRFCFLEAVLRSRRISANNFALRPRPCVSILEHCQSQETSMASSTLQND